MRHPFLEGLRPTLHISHRGGAALAPENTLPAFRQALERYRTDMLELDVQPTKDGSLVVTHDPTLERCTNGEGAISELSLAQVQKLDAGYQFSPDGGQTFPFRGQGVRLSTFDELLAAFPGLRINVELKSAPSGAADEFAAIVRKARAVNRVCCGSELDEIGAQLVRALPDACHFYPRNALAELVFALRSGEAPPNDERFTVLDMPLEFGGVRLIDPPFLQAMAALGKWVNVWTVDDPAEMKQLIAEGVGGIMTDRPDLLRAELDGR